MIDIDFMTEPLPGAQLHTLLAKLRADGPVADITLWGQPAQLLLRYGDIRDYLAAHEQFPGGDVYQFHTQPVVGDTFISMNGPGHDQYRQLATPAFRSRATTRFVDEERTPLADEIVDRFADHGEVDLYEVFVGVLPFWAISRKLGLPPGTEDHQRRWALQILSFPVDPEGALAAADAVTDFLMPALEERRREPRDDVLSHLLHAEYDGMRFTDAEVVAHVRLLYSVGATTTSDSMSSMFWTLLNNPDLLARAHREPELRPRIVHESLRYEPPVALLPRIAPYGGEVGGVTIPEGHLARGTRVREPRRCGVQQPRHLRPRSRAGRVLDLRRLVDADPPSGAILRRTEHLQVAWDA